MRIQLVLKINSDEKILSVAINNELLLTGGTSRYMRRLDKNNKLINIVRHTKSVRTVCINDNMYGCGSYDGRASLFQDGRLVDTLEGPDSEIKCMAIGQLVALATRTGTVWLYDHEGNIDSMINDMGDIKGVLWYSELLFTYGSEGIINIYSRNLDWELLQVLQQGCTIWKVVEWNGKIVSADHEGFLWIYRKESTFVLENKIKASVYPICDMVIGNGFLHYVCNRDYINILNGSLTSVAIIKSEGGVDEINCIDYCEKNNTLVVGSDHYLKCYKISE